MQQDSTTTAGTTTQTQPDSAAHHAGRDTLHLPLRRAGKSVIEVHLPQYHSETFFDRDSATLSVAGGSSYGVAGDPVPYTVRGDNMITLMLIASLVMVLVAYGRSGRFMARQIKGFFRTPRREDANPSETSGEVRLQLFLVLQTCLLLAILQYFYTQTYIGSTFVLPSQYQLIAIFFAMFLGLFAIRSLLYTAVNLVFFSGKKNRQWQNTLLLLGAVEGVVLFPVVMLQVYFSLSMQNVVAYTLIVLFLIKILTLYKCYAIFFRRSGVFLQIILYFCALEAVPMAAFWGLLVNTATYLRINF